MKKSRIATSIPVLLSLILVFYCLWAIRHQSFCAIDGKRYFTIADDGLISLRYGWNLAHGDGLVWNPGEYIEGITNTLWTLQASFFSLFLDKRILPLAMQVAAIGWLFFTAYFFLKSARSCLPSASESAMNTFLAALAFLLPLSYFPLVFWSLRGMETSLQAALLSAAVYMFLRAPNRSFVFGSFLLGLLCLTRPDGIVPSAILFGFRILRVFRKELNWKQLIVDLLPFVCILSGMTIFRVLYYGSPIPNTYILKVEGFSMMERITLNGLGYIGPFIYKSWPLFLAVVVSLVVRPTFEKVMLATLPAAMLIYTIYIGGDAFSEWRFLGPFVPYAFFVLLLDLPILNEKLRKLLTPLKAGPPYRYAILSLAVFLLLTLARPGLFDSYVQRFQKPSQDNIENINTAIWLNTILRPSATVGVFYAGSIPFYTGRYAIDFLGKNDKYIAGLEPDKSGAVSWLGHTSVPGHNKYDLDYSVLKRLPTFAQGLLWGSQNVSIPAKKKYLSVGVASSEIILFLRKGSPHVRWDRLRHLTANKRFN